MVSDVAARGVYQVAITNNGACLKGTVTLVMKLPETSEPFGLACDDSQLYVPDSSREGGKTKLNLATLESDKLVSNGSEDCHTVHGLAVTKNVTWSSQTEVLELFGCSFLNRTLALRSKQLQDQGCGLKGWFVSLCLFFSANCRVYRGKNSLCC